MPAQGDPPPIDPKPNQTFDRENGEELQQKAKDAEKAHQENQDEQGEDETA